MTRSVRVVITGRVQGVGFRWATRRAAEGAGVAGWVANRADGSVEAVFAGEASAVQRMLDFVAVGPPGARVDAVHVHEPHSAPSGEKFVVR